MSVFLVMLPSPTVIRKESSLHCCILKVNNEKIFLANYYGLNSDEIYLLEDFCNRIEQFNDMPIACGGDWNHDSLASCQHRNFNHVLYKFKCNQASRQSSLTPTSQL
jgi:hypothetical protein